MRRIATAVLTAIITILLASAFCLADVAWNTKREMAVKNGLADMTFSRDGQWLYLLYENGSLDVFDFRGEQKGNVMVGRGFDQIEAGPLEDEVYLVSRKTNSVKIIEVTPVRQINTSGSPFKGTDNAPIVITEFTDFQCPYCAKLGAIFDQMLKRYPGKIKIVYKSYPLNNHRYAWKAAVNAMAAHQKGLFWKFHDRLFENHNQLNDQKIMQIRKEFGLDTPEFDTLTKSPELRAKVANDRSEGKALGVRGTPAVYINGKRLQDKSAAGFQKAIDRELKSLNK